MKSNFPIPNPPLANYTTLNYFQKYLKNEYKAQNTALKIICIILFVVTCFNTMFALLMIYKNSFIVEENFQLIQENRMLIVFQQFMIQTYPTYAYNEPNDEMVDDIDIDYLVDKNNTASSSDIIKLARMVDKRLSKDCPPCTTEKPSIVEPHKNPVSILNELTHHARYDCDHQCLNPPIHLSTLTVSDPKFPEKIFNGKGESKQKSKQVAAYRALEFYFPEHLDEIAENNQPDLDYKPICLGTMLNSDRDKC